MDSASGERRTKMASVGQSFLAVLVLTAVTSAAGSSIFSNVVDMMLHPKETLNAAMSTATEMAIRIPDAVIVKTLESYRGLLKRSHPLLGIPALDPYFLSHLDIAHNLSGISEMEGFVDNMMVRGLSAYRLKHLAVNWVDSSANVSLVIPQVDLDGFYNVNGTFADFLPVYGEGPFRVNIRNLELNTVLGLRYLNKSLSVDVVDLDYNVSHLESNFGGIMGGQETGDMVNEVINEKSLHLLEELTPVVKPIALHYVLSGLNAHLRKMHLSRSDLLSWIPSASRIRELWGSGVDRR